MKYIYRFFQLSAITLASIGCSDMIDEGKIDDSAEFENRATLTLSADVKSRVAFEYVEGFGIKTSWEADDVISVFSENGAEHLVDFKLKEAVAANGTATFVAESNYFAFDDGANYKIVYPATNIYSSIKTFEEMTQSNSGDASHLDGNLIMAADYSYQQAQATVITLMSQQCVVKASIKNLNGWIPKKVVYTIGSQSATVNLATYTSGDAVVLIPSNPQESGAVPNFTVTYDNGEGGTNEVKSDFSISALSKNHDTGTVYKLNLDMGNVLSSVDAGDATADSNDNEIIVPVGMAMDVASKDGFSISVSNEDFEGEQGVSIISARADGKNIVLALDSPIYNDDKVTISFNGAGVTANEGATVLNAFSDMTVTPKATNLINVTESWSAQEMFSFEDEGVYNMLTTPIKGFELSSPADSDRGVSLRYAKELCVTTLTDPKTIAYYLGSKSTGGSRLAPDYAVKVPSGFKYVVKFDIYMLTAFGTQTDSSGSVYTNDLLRVRYNSTTNPNVRVLPNYDFDTEDAQFHNQWHTVESVFNFDGDGYSGTITGDMSFVFEGTYAYANAPDIEFYLDNLRFYKQIDLYRSAKAEPQPEEPDSGFALGDIAVGGDLDGWDETQTEMP